MRVTRAIMRQHGMVVTIDGREFQNDTKYTFLERGYATYLFHGEETPEFRLWIRENGESMHGDTEQNGNDLDSGGNMLVTSDPILFALAYEAWWAMNGRPLPLGRNLPIPLYRESVVIMRTREILNPFNVKYRGVVPDSIRRWAN